MQPDRIWSNLHLVNGQSNETNVSKAILMTISLDYVTCNKFVHAVFVSLVRKTGGTEHIIAIL
jgi:hypothetical protein